MGQKFFQGFLVVIAVLVSGWFFWFHGKDKVVFHGDALGYYAYLPSTFIYHNHKDIRALPDDRDLEPYIVSTFRNWDQGNKPTPKGYILNQYTYGVALMEAPFFFAAHAWEKMSGKKANGYSRSYANAIKISAFFFAILGLLAVFCIVKWYYGGTVSVITVVLLFLGTNLFWFTIMQAGMAHMALFLLYALLLLGTIRAYEAPRFGRFAAVGFVAGLITIIRPTDVICLLIPLLYNVYNRETLRKRMHFFAANYRFIIVAAIAFFTPIMPQLLYWKMMTGNFLYYSYGSQSFDWAHPKLIEGLLYCKNGWLAYSPVMFFAIAGMFLYRRIKPWAWVTWIIFPIYSYVVYSWYCFNYINGLGSRPMIHLYPLLAIPLAAFIAFVGQRRLWAKVLFFVVAAGFTVLNINFTFQQSKGLLQSDESNLTFNMNMLFRDYLEYNDVVTYDVGELQPDKNKLTKLYSLACITFEDSVSDHYLADPTGRSKYVYQMKDDDYLPAAIEVAYSSTKYKGAKWIKASGRFMYTECIPYRHTLCLSVSRGDKSLDNKIVAIENKISLPYYNTERRPFSINHCAPNEWGEVFFFARLPADIQDGDVIRVFPWNRPKKNIFMDDLCIELYK